MTRTPIPNCPQPETPIRERAWTDGQITAAARALCNRSAEVCNVDPQDNWNLYANEFIEDAKAALNAINGATP